MLDLIEDMIAAVVKEQNATWDVVLDWDWTRLLRAYRQVGRATYEQFMSNINATEIAAGRAIAATIGGQKNKPLPTYQSVHKDAFAPPPVKTGKATGFMAKYLAANKLDGDDAAQPQEEPLWTSEPSG